MSLVFATFVLPDPKLQRIRCGSIISAQFKITKAYKLLKPGYRCTTKLALGGEDHTPKSCYDLLLTKAECNTGLGYFYLNDDEDCRCCTEADALATSEEKLGYNLYGPEIPPQQCTITPKSTVAPIEISADKTVPVETFFNDITATCKLTGCQLDAVQDGVSVSDNG